MQSASKAVIVLDLNNFDPKEVIIVSVDCVNYATTEFRLDPSTMWFDHKSHGPGLKYEFGVCVHSVSSSKVFLLVHLNSVSNLLFHNTALLCLDQRPVSSREI